LHFTKRNVGAEIAEKMLADNGIRDAVISTPGQLTDHYNPVE
jgi:Zn-dependent membrane protease YugP